MDNKIVKLKFAILACIRITDKNIINLQARLLGRSKPEVTIVIAQADALSIFKGNLIKVLKAYYTPSDISRIKRTLGLELCLGNSEQSPNTFHIVEAAKVKWLNNAEWLPHFVESIQTEIQAAFFSISDDDIIMEGKAALQDYYKDLPKGQVHIIHPKDINLSSILNIKFA